MRPKMNSALLDFVPLGIELEDPQRGRIEPDSATRGLIMAMNELAKAIELLTKMEWAEGKCVLCEGYEDHKPGCELAKFLKMSNCHHSAQSWWYDEAGEKHCSDCEETD